MIMLKQDPRPMSGSGYGRNSTGGAGGRNSAPVRRNMSSARSSHSQARPSLETPPSSPNGARRDRTRGSATCCFSCCGLTVRGSSENSSASRPGTNSKPKNNLSTAGPPIDSESLPTADDVKAWGEGFDNVMSKPIGRKWFRDFLRCEYSEENILFWQACEDLKKETNPEVVEEKARIIYEDYISILSPKEVSLDSRVREIINRNMVEPSRHTFDEAQVQIYTLMGRDSYPRFINSPLYRQLVDTLLKPRQHSQQQQQQNNSGASSHPQSQSASRNSALNRSDRGSTSAS